MECRLKIDGACLRACTQERHFFGRKQMNIRISCLKNAVAIAMVAAVGTVGLPMEASAGINGAAVQSYNVAATTAGMPVTAQTLWAVVTATGATTRSFPRATTTSSRLGAGSYEVDFYESVNACSYQVTLGNGSTGTPPTGYASVASRAGNSKGVFVQTFNLNGAPVDHPFHLAVHC
jgi:hypothetical protein